MTLAERIAAAIADDFERRSSSAVALTAELRLELEADWTAIVDRHIREATGVR